MNHPDTQVLPSLRPDAAGPIGTGDAVALALLAARLRADGWDCMLHRGCDHAAMLVIEGRDRAGGPVTYVASAMRAALLRLELLAEDSYLQLDSEAPPDRILERLAAARA